jgi:RHS repeat-associated protein
MVTPSDQVYCYDFNAIGSTIAMTDSSQNMVNKYAYDPFGNVANQVEAVTQPFKFVGQFGVITEPNGFYYMRARYYDPSVGRFISEDPIGFGGGDVNLMVYVANNPGNFVDPQGSDVLFFGIGMAGFIGKSPAPNSKTGYAAQSSVGIALDTKTWELRFYTSTGVANQDTDIVKGAGLGIGPYGGYLEGGMGDFLGLARERTSYWAVFSTTEIETQSGKKGSSASAGGKGFGWGYTSIETCTK